MASELRQTPLYEDHVKAGAKMVDFAGWSMPINYGSQIREHEIVRTDAGMFDVSHMRILDISGSDAKVWLQHILANDVDKLKEPGKALYSAMLNEQGGVIDDLIVYLMQDGYRMVVNAGTAEKDLAWLQKTAAGKAVTIKVRDDLGILAVQGPHAIEKVCQAKPEWADTIHTLKVFQGIPIGDCFIARTGYTGEDGLEIMVPATQISALFQSLIQTGVAPCGLGARDTLRLEAGMNLYGHDMDENTSPLVAGMGWTIAWEPTERRFIGRDKLEAEKAAGLKEKQVGLVLNSKGLLRDGMKIDVEGVGQGIITSGSFSPTLGLSIAIARIPKATTPENVVTVDLRGVKTPVQVVKMPFVRHGKKVYE